VDGDGTDDVLVGAQGSDDQAAFLFCGSISGELVLSDADARLLLGANDSSIAGAGDIDADGYADVLVGTQGNGTAGSQAGAVFLGYGLLSGDVDLAAQGAMFLGENARDWAGISVAGAGDVDGNGMDDILIGAYGFDENGSNAGAAYLILSQEP
jgi:hypothetical protein